MTSRLVPPSVVPFEPRLCHQVRIHLPAPVDPTGEHGPTRGAAAGNRWRRVGPRAYVPAHVDGEVPEQRIAEAAAFLRDGGAVTAWGGLRLAGAAYFDGTVQHTRQPVLLALGRPSGRSGQPGLAFSYEPLPAVEVFRTQGVPAAVPLRSLFDEVRRLDRLEDRVVAIDMAAAARMTSCARLREYYEQHRTWRRASRVLEALGFAHEGSLSPPESRLRLIWVLDVRLPVPHVNCTLRRLDGTLICKPDLFDEEAGLVIEYDGAEHGLATRRANDAGRYERCRDAGLEYCTITGPDMHERREVVARLVAARARAPFTAPHDRRWRVALDPPNAVDDYLDRCEALSRQVRAERGVWVPPW